MTFVRAIGYVSLGFLVFFRSPYAKGEDAASASLRQHGDRIVAAADVFRISPRLLASVIYAERSRNVRPGEAIIDELLAGSGYNASIGFAQIKLRTAEWIEAQWFDQDRQMQAFAGLPHPLPRSGSRSEIIRRLADPGTNLIYAAAYCAMIMKLWDAVIQAPWNHSRHVGIVATLYVLGLVLPNGSIRMPNMNPKLNDFGLCAQEFYDSVRLTSEFPR